MKLIGIDPGNEISALVTNDMRFYMLPNYDILQILCGNFFDKDSILSLEMIACYGMPAGKTLFETALWIGRFIEAWNGRYCLVYRKDIKLHFCGTFRAKDPHVRQVMIDRFGEPGTKKNPGLLYGIKKDLWQALAVTIYTQDILLHDDKISTIEIRDSSSS